MYLQAGLCRRARRPPSALAHPKKTGPKISPCCSFFCYEAGGRDPPPPSFNQPPIVKYERRASPLPSQISLLFSHTNCPQHTTPHYPGLHITQPSEYLSSLQNPAHVQVLALGLDWRRTFPLVRIFPSCPAIKALAAVAAQDVVLCLVPTSTSSPLGACICKPIWPPVPPTQPRIVESKQVLPRVADESRSSTEHHNTHPIAPVLPRVRTLFAFWWLLSFGVVFFLHFSLIPQQTSLSHAIPPSPHDAKREGATCRRGLSRQVPALSPRLLFSPFLPPFSPTTETPSGASAGLDVNLWFSVSP